MAVERRLPRRGNAVELVDGVLAGDRRAVARLISHIEDERPGVREAIARLTPHTGRAHIVGVTGAPGSGKSTLVTALAKEIRRRGQRVGVVAVDPTSPFTGGAVLGDRVRMMELSGDAGVFIRSMASRGRLGGIAAATADAVRVLDAAGFEIVLIETVGAGQGEIEIARTADTVLVVEVPGLGDDIQAIKAGIMEIADIFVVNKADRPEVDRVVSVLRTMLSLGQKSADWQPPIVKTIAATGQGVPELLDQIERHHAYLMAEHRLEARQRERLRRELLHAADAIFRRELQARAGAAAVDAAVEELLARRTDPHTAAAALLRAAGYRA